MSLGLGNIILQQKRELATVAGANNGVSLSGTNVVLGNDVGGTAAQLTSNREIPLANRSIAFTDQVGTSAQTLTITQARIEFLGAGNFLGNIATNFIQGYASNSGGGGQLLGQRFGLAVGNEIYLAVNTSAGLNNLRAGANISAFGAVAGTFGIHAETALELLAGNASASLATQNIRMTATITQLRKIVEFFVNTARTGAGSVTLRNNGNGQAQFLQGASGSFTAASGETITVLDGIITNIV